MDWHVDTRKKLILGGNGVPRSFVIEQSYIDTYSLVVVFVVVIAGCALSIAFCALNIRWRNFK